MTTMGTVQESGDTTVTFPAGYQPLQQVQDFTVVDALRASVAVSTTRNSIVCSSP
jgi:hypothetical protein